MSEATNSPLKPGRSRMPSEQKDKIRAEQLARRLYKFANSKGKSTQRHAMSQAQVTAAKVLIDKGKPSLQSVESREVEEPKSESELKAQLHALLPELLSDPGIRAQALAILSGSPTPVERGQDATIAPHNDTSPLRERKA